MAVHMSESVKLAYLRALIAITRGRVARFDAIDLLTFEAEVQS